VQLANKAQFREFHIKRHETLIHCKNVVVAGERDIGRAAQIAQHEAPHAGNAQRLDTSHGNARPK